jgi:hypothetical protein
MKITLLGAADTVIGSRHLVEAGGARVLLDSAHLHEEDVLARLDAFALVRGRDLRQRQGHRRARAALLEGDGAAAAQGLVGAAGRRSIIIFIIECIICMRLSIIW